ncbi:unnamed protein product [Cercopithifilaria johnstoni]|uniref:Protein ARV n=1 Tax=Cercopithifilaria johnstoni TaxID=2874296 RepID=A0A8J2LXL1_9BILA|nr:unnamed protein product [Cercopithifilaria johnstoni]
MPYLFFLNPTNAYELPPLYPHHQIHHKLQRITVPEGFIVLRASKWLAALTPAQMITAKDEYICINCCHPSSSLFLKYSDNGIRLTPCFNCGKAVDAYIEYDIVLYCHKLCIIFVVCNAYSKWIRRRIMSGNENVYDLEWKFYECLLQSLLEMVSFMIVLALMSPHICTTLSVNKTLQIFCVGSYGNVFAVLSVIWNLHFLWSYRVLTEMFIFISHVQTQRALCNMALSRSIFITVMATLISRSIGLLIYSFCFI